MVALHPRYARALLALLPALSACDDPTEPDPAVAEVTVIAPATTLQAGDTVQLTASAVDRQRRPIAAGIVTWSSSDTAVIVVTQSGQARAVRDGAAEVRASVGGMTGHVALAVRTQVARIVLSPGTGVLRLGRSTLVTATLLDARGGAIQGRAVAWSASGGVTVDSSGTVTATALGTARITATLDGVSQVATIEVVSPVVETGVLATGVTHACGLAGDGKVYCWGNNSYGLLGTGRVDTEAHPLPEAVLTGQAFTSLSSQGGFTCALTPGGQVYCWGADRGGSLGTVVTQSCDTEVGRLPCSPVPVAVASSLTFRSVQAMWTHACALTAGGTAYCWGPNDRGQLGNRTLTGSATPVAVAGGTSFRSITGSREHTCGIGSDQRAYCWGDNSSGQLGIGTIDSIPRTAPIAVGTSLAFRSLSAHGQSGGHTCGVATDDRIYCWGSNDYGQLGTGTTGTGVTPTAIATSERFASVAAGHNWTCGLTVAGEAHCWGSAAGGTIPGADRTCSGRAGTLPCRAVPTRVAPGLVLSTIRPGSASACAVTADDRAHCWGANTVGKLGSGTTADSPTPVRVAGATQFPTVPPVGPLPAVLQECETNTARVCGTWTLENGRYRARWAQGSEAVITVERFDSALIVFLREDTAGPTTGLRARYTAVPGVRSVRNGTVVWTHQGQSFSGSWDADW